MKWFKDYFEERCQAAAERNYVGHINTKEKDTKALPPQNDLLNKVKGAFSSGFFKR